ncbi:MAG: HlyD family type I secretion periplasmic adaptor subunit [Lautropia sp.]
MDREVRRLILFGVVTLLSFAAAFAAWASLAPLGGAVVISGSVAVESERKTVQHLEGGIVKAILVKPGSNVRKGEPVLLLEEVGADAAVASLRQQLDADLARVARLEAERNNASSFGMPPELAPRLADPVVALVVEPERKLFETRRKALADQIDLYRSESRQITQEIESLSGQVAANLTAIEAMTEQVRINEALTHERFVSQARLLDLRAQLADRIARRDEARAALAQARQRLAQNDMKVVATRQSYVREATVELRDAERRVNELRERLRPSEDVLKRTTIVAPIDGEIVDLRVHTVGGVVPPREPLMDIVPAEAPMLIKGRMPIDAITHVHVGSDVTVQLTAYKRRVTPSVVGRLSYISADSLSERTLAGSASFYEVRIVVERDALKVAGDLVMSPGMPVEAYLNTGARSLFDYLLQPVTQSLGRAFREY